MNILVIRFSSLGDLVTLALIKNAIRYFFPDANIVFLTSNIGKSLYEDTKIFDRFIVYHNAISTLKELRDTKYDIVFNLHCNSLSHMLVALLKKSKVINSAANLIQKMLHIKVKVRPVQITLQESGISKAKIDAYFKQENSNKIILPVSNKKVIQTDKKVVAISTGSSEKWKSKQWGVQNYIDLIKKLQQNNIQVVLIGTKLEENDAKQIMKSCTGVISYVNSTNLTKLKSILFQADLYIGNDSGPSHIAAALKTNTITIFGPTSTRHCVKDMPYTGKHICIKPSKEIDCHPCYKASCPTKLECMKSISVDEVFNAAKSMGVV